MALGCPVLENPRSRASVTATSTLSNGVVVVELNHATVAAAATLTGDYLVGKYLLVVNKSASGTAAHTVVLPTGYAWNTSGNKTVTLNAPGKFAYVYFGSDKVATQIALSASAPTFSA